MFLYTSEGGAQFWKDHPPEGRNYRDRMEELNPTRFIIAKTSEEGTGMLLSLEHIRYFIFSNLNS